MPAFGYQPVTIIIHKNGIAIGLKALMNIEA
jgi:hypothetical protein